MTRSAEFCYVVRKMPPRVVPKGEAVDYVRTIVQGAVLWTQDKNMALRITIAGWKDIGTNLQRAAKTLIMVERIGV